MWIRRRILQESRTGRGPTFVRVFTPVTWLSLSSCDVQMQLHAWPLTTDQWPRTARATLTTLTSAARFNYQQSQTVTSTSSPLSLTLWPLWPSMTPWLDPILPYTTVAGRRRRYRWRRRIWWRHVRTGFKRQIADKFHSADASLFHYFALSSHA